MDTLIKPRVAPTILKPQDLTPRRARGDRWGSHRPSPLSRQRSSNYVELLARSNFSFLQGASHPHEMVYQAMEHGYKGLALCDVNGLYGVVRGHQATYRPSHFSTTPGEKLGHSFKFMVGTELQLKELCLAILPLNKNGYENLCQLLTRGKFSAPKNFLSLTLHDILNENQDLIALPLPPWNWDHLLALKEVFQERLFLPVWRDLTWGSLKYFEQALELERQGFQLVATQRPFMHTKDRKPLFDVLTCLLHKTTLKSAQTLLKSNEEFYLKSLSELNFLWKDRLDLMEKTLDIASEINFNLKELRYTYPRDYLPTGTTPTEYLRQLTFKGLKSRYPQGIPEKIIGTTEKELSFIQELKYEDYFLTLWEICEFAKARDILFQGRGSAANSVVCFGLGLTNVDPTHIDLLFERFLSKERGEPPDIDIDFEHDRREEVIQYIYERYGRERASMVNTVITYRSRMALRDVAKAMGVPPLQISKMVDHMGREGIESFLSRPANLSQFEISPAQLQQILKLSFELKSFPRHLGIHTGGFVISATPLSRIVPLERASMDGRHIIQWNKDDVEALGLMKIDVLGLGMLSALKRGLTLLSDHKGLDLKLHQIPADDIPTYEMIQKAETIGVFQIESRAQMSLLPRLKPKCFYDLVIEVAIVRPGPLQGGMVHPYLRRRDGKEPVRYLHPKLEKILKKTHGVPIFQEQIMQMAVAVANFSPGEADELRRIMSSSWQKQTLMEGVRTRLLNGMVQNGLSIEDAENIFKSIQGFASYGFPESHAASFAHLTYASCYLKKHHPEVFLCSLLNSQPMGFYAPRTLILEAQKNGVTILPPDVQKSDEDSTLETLENSYSSITTSKFQHAVRLGLSSIYGIPKKTLQRILEERKRGPFKSLNDFVSRCDISSNYLKKMALAGAFSGFGVTARQALWHLSHLGKLGDLFKFKPEALETSWPPLKEESPWEGLERDYRQLGFSVEHHPMGILRPALLHSNSLLSSQGKPCFVSSQDLPSVKDRKRVKVAGLLSMLQRPPTAKGMVFITLEDEWGAINLILDPSTYQKYRWVILDHQLLWCEGIFQNTQGVFHIKARQLAPLPIERMKESLKKLPTGEEKTSLDPHL